MVFLKSHISLALVYNPKMSCAWHTEKVRIDMYLQTRHNSITKLDWKRDCLFFLIYFLDWWWYESREGFSKPLPSFFLSFTTTSHSSRASPREEEEARWSVTHEGCGVGSSMIVKLSRLHELKLLLFLQGLCGMDALKSRGIYNPQEMPTIKRGLKTKDIRHSKHHKQCHQ